MTAFKMRMSFSSSKFKSLHIGIGLRLSVRLFPGSGPGTVSAIELAREDFLLICIMPTKICEIKDVANLNPKFLNLSVPKNYKLNQKWFMPCGLGEISPGQSTTGLSLYNFLTPIGSFLWWFNLNLLLVPFTHRHIAQPVRRALPCRLCPPCQPCWCIWSGATSYRRRPGSQITSHSSITVCLAATPRWCRTPSWIYAHLASIFLL